MFSLGRATSAFGAPRHGAKQVAIFLTFRGRFCSTDSLVECSKVYARRDAYGGVGTFAAQRIQKGEVVERGVARRLPVDGNNSQYVFTWSPDRSIWASGSGCSIFYNASLTSPANTEMYRHFEEDTFEIVALRDIQEDEELTHLYKSLEWRPCFKELKAIRDGMLASGGEASTPALQPLAKEKRPELVDCSKVYAKKDAYGGVGAYARQAIKKGELVERGIVRRLPVDGNESPFVFTWSEDKSVWATGSGLSVYYNASLDGNENTEMIRYFDEDRFEIYAIRDIAKDEELTHLYKSIEWRECFKDLKAIREAAGKSSAGNTNDNGNAKIKNGNGNGNGGGKARDSFLEYWNADHSAPTLENMMLDSNAGQMDRLERPEILSALPSLAGKRVLELGAGIGRFSGILAQKSGEVLAVDFVESSCAENRRLNAHHKNLKVQHDDVTMLELEPKSFELVFSNWLLMYLTDDEVRDFATNVLKWLRPGGHLFFRESCFHASGDAARRFNPTQYRDPNAYSQIFSEAVAEDGSRFQLQATNCVESYAQIKGNVHQMWFRWEKIGPYASQRRTHFLQTGQYTAAHCMRYEKIYGRGYVCVGGDDFSQRLLNYVSPTIFRGARLMEIGSGLGGTASFCARQRPDIYVHGVCFSGDCYSLVTGRNVKSPKELRERLTFDLAPECGVPEHELRYLPNAFDAIIVRDNLMHLDLEDKPVILQKVNRLLRPGGKVIVVDYGLGKPLDEVSSDLKEHIKENGYHLLHPKEEKALLERWFEVEEIDVTNSFIEYLQQGLAVIEAEFGEGCAVRKNAGNNLEPELEAAKTSIIEAMQKAISRLPQNALEDASTSALSTLKMHLDAEVADAEKCEVDYEWARRTWLLEQTAAKSGDLKW
eukprot:CAMPEP_0206458884 /NCGR_PEP_ID=MMETSP0324_2-20121206/23841_1 /ASSEMBLY_ACC=CAM_ASM_000836 /TAXON_ID=2866 /ORGANISM="Crypthecodinium cohnii, Strain Seligo" /LENGTH=882 /DNA_ID=CAMNT_0053930319 /DNA_START=59 /DNA_END=2704 /DNA_ORIENTATION=-